MRFFKGKEAYHCVLQWNCFCFKKNERKIQKTIQGGSPDSIAAASHSPDDGCIEDTAVALDDLENYIAEFTALMKTYDVNIP